MPARDMSPAAADANLAALVARCQGEFAYFELAGDSRLGVYNARDFERYANLTPVVLPFDQQRGIAPLHATGTTVGWTARFLNRRLRLYAACEPSLVAYGRAIVLWAGVDYLDALSLATPLVSQSLLPRPDRGL